jgi:hypothetical protein
VLPKSNSWFALVAGACVQAIFRNKHQEIACKQAPTSSAARQIVLGNTPVHFALGCPAFPGQLGLQTLG